MKMFRGRWPVAGGRWVCVVLVIAGLAGCGAASESGSAIGDAAHGRRLYRGEEKLALNTNTACIDCHNDTVGGESPIGQNLSNIGNRAAAVVPGQSAVDYLRASILKPDEHLSGNFQEGIMPRTYPETLTDQDVDDLIAYMLTLKSGVDE